MTIRLIEKLSNNPKLLEELKIEINACQSSFKDESKADSRMELSDKSFEAVC